MSLHPRNGKCSRCNRTLGIVADFGVDMYMLHDTRGRDAKGRLLGGGDVLHSHWTFSMPLCRRCVRQTMVDGNQSQVQLSSRGVTMRLTRKQKAARDRKKLLKSKRTRCS